MASPQRLEGGVETRGGPGGGKLYWANSGRHGVLRSIVVPAAGCGVTCGARLQTVDAAGPVPKMVSDQHLTDEVADAADPSGGVVFVKGIDRPVGPDMNTYEPYHWDPAQPSNDPQLLGHFTVPSDQTDSVLELVLLPSGGSGEPGPRIASVGPALAGVGMAAHLPVRTRAGPTACYDSRMGRTWPRRRR